MSNNVRRLTLPHGGTLDIPLPGSNGEMTMRPAGALAAADGGSLIPAILIGVVVGVGIGVGLTYYFQHRR